MWLPGCCGSTHHPLPAPESLCSLKAVGLGSSHLAHFAEFPIGLRQTPPGRRAPCPPAWFDSLPAACRLETPSRSSRTRAQLNATAPASEGVGADGTAAPSSEGYNLLLKNTTNNQTTAGLLETGPRSGVPIPQQPCPTRPAPQQHSAQRHPERWHRAGAGTHAASTRIGAI